MGNEPDDDSGEVELEEGGVVERVPRGDVVSTAPRRATRRERNRFIGSDSLNIGLDRESVKRRSVSFGGPCGGHRAKAPQAPAGCDNRQGRRPEVRAVKAGVP